MRVCTSVKKRERGRGREFKKLSLSREFPSQLPFISSALTLLAKPEALGVYSEIWHPFIAVSCTTHFDTVSGGFGVCNPMERTAVV